MRFVTAGLAMIGVVGVVAAMYGALQRNDGAVALLVVYAALAAIGLGIMVLATKRR